jgi:hypothetical protein
MAPESEQNWSSDISKSDEDGKFNIESASGRVEERSTEKPEDRISPSERLRKISEEDWEYVCDEAKKATDANLEDDKKHLSPHEYNRKYDNMYNALKEDLALQILLKMPELSKLKKKKAN